MFYIGQEVMIIGDSRCPIGTVDRILEVSPCDMGDRGVQYLYRLAGKPRLQGLEIYFQAQHLMPVGEETTESGGLMDLELPQEM
jgi:hypothetical protein